MRPIDFHYPVCPLYTRILYRWHLRRAQLRAARFGKICATWQLFRTTTTAYSLYYSKSSCTIIVHVYLFFFIYIYNKSYKLYVYYVHTCTLIFPRRTSIISLYASYVLFALNIIIFYSETFWILYPILLATYYYIIFDIIWCVPTTETIDRDQYDATTNRVRPRIVVSAALFAVSVYYIIIHAYKAVTFAYIYIYI